MIGPWRNGVILSRLDCFVLLPSFWMLPNEPNWVLAWGLNGTMLLYDIWAESTIFYCLYGSSSSCYLPILVRLTARTLFFLKYTCWLPGLG